MLAGGQGDLGPIPKVGGGDRVALFSLQQNVQTHASDGDVEILGLKTGPVGGNFLFLIPQGAVPELKFEVLAGFFGDSLDERDHSGAEAVVVAQESLGRQGVGSGQVQTLQFVLV